MKHPIFEEDQDDEEVVYHGPIPLNELFSGSAIDDFNEFPEDSEFENIEDDNSFEYEDDLESDDFTYEEK